MQKSSSIFLLLLVSTQNVVYSFCHGTNQEGNREKQLLKSCIA